MTVGRGGDRVCLTMSGLPNLVGEERPAAHNIEVHEEHVVLSGGRNVAALPAGHLALEPGTELEVGHQRGVGFEETLAGVGGYQRGQLVGSTPHFVHIFRGQSRSCRFG